MTAPGWWNERRYGLFVHASIATVPSFSPIGESAGWYWSHLGSDTLAGIDQQASPMAEVLAYHRDRWSHVDAYDDFLPFLSYHRFDADEQVELAIDAGMNYLVHVAKHRDGFCWWDAPGTDRTSVLHGPRRNVIAEVADAARRRNVQFGTSYSLVDWADERSATPSYVDEVLHPHVIDLVERYDASILLADSDLAQHSQSIGPGPSFWQRTEKLLDEARHGAEARGLTMLFNDRWGHPRPNFATREHDPPAEIDLRPWELCRSLGTTFGHNRAERPEHLLTTGALFDLLTEVIAKGGKLLLGVGPSVDGTVSDIQKRPLREVGAWVRDRADVIHASRPFDLWGDAQIRYVRVGDDVVALDLSAGAVVVLAGLTPQRYEITSIEAEDGGSLHWEQHRAGVTISRIDRSPSGLAGMYRLSLRPAVESIRLFEHSGATPQPLQRLLDAAVPGDVIQLRDGTYQGPVLVPKGVIVRGAGWDRTAIAGVAGLIARLEPGARIENVDLVGTSVDRVDSAGPSAGARIAAAAAVHLQGNGAAIVGCRCDGYILVEADDATVMSVIGGGVVGTAERTTVERCAFKGTGLELGISLTGGSGHRIHRNEVIDHRCSVRLGEASESVVSENRLSGRCWAVHLRHCEHVEVVNNHIQHSMRAVDVEGGNGSVITGNWVADGDSGALIEFGATDTAVIDNHVERCRIGVLVWDAPTTRVGPNTFVDLHEEGPIVSGPEADADADLS